MEDSADKRWKLEKLFIFFRYMLLEPFRQLAKPKAWMYIWFLIFFVTLLRGQKLEQMISFFVLLFLFLWHEWESGKFMEDYRRRYGKQYRSP